jgi:RNA polymerase sigma factor (sigma-70 family)
MTDLLSDIETPSDAELISRVRGGDIAAYGELFSRHVSAANRLSRQLIRGPDADDLVSEAFAKVLQVLRGGGGPDVAFRAYLLTAVRRLHVDKIRSSSKLQTTDDMTPFDPGVPFQDTAVAGFESGAAAKAFASLPERWQLVLWHLEVEGQKPAEIAPLLGMSANSVSALAYRAREGLRQAFLTMHLSDISDTECRWVNEHLGGFVRKGLAKRETAKVQTHLDGCRRCTAMYLELTEVNSNLSGIIAPLLLGTAATGYLASSGAAGASGLLGLVGKTKEVIAANSGVATAGAIAAGVAALATTGILLALGHSNSIAGADQPTSTTQSASPAPGAAASPSTGPVSGPSGGPTTPPATPTSSVPFGVLKPAVGPLVPSASATAGPSAPGSSPSDSPSSGSTGGPANPPAVSSDLSVADAVIKNQGVSVSVDGSPVLPPTFHVSLRSSPSGITFAQGGGDCTVNPNNPMVATCDTSAQLSRQVIRDRALAVADASNSRSVFIPFAIPGQQPTTDLDVDVSVPDGYRDPVSTNNSRHFTYQPPVPPAIEVDVAMGDLDPTSPGPDRDGLYTVSSHVTGLTGLPSVRYQLTGAATFVGLIPVGCTGTGTTVLTCSNPPDGTISFMLAADDDTAPTPVTIAAAVPNGYVDVKPTNDSASATLTPLTRVDVAMGNLTPNPSAPDDQGNHALSSTVTGVAGLPRVAYSLTGAATFVGPIPAGCTGTGTTALSCTNPTGGSIGFTLAADDETASTNVTITAMVPEGFIDTDPGNDTTAAATLEPAPLDDVVMDSLAQQSQSGEVTIVHAQVSGIPLSATTVLFHLSDPAHPGTAPDQVWFTGGDDGASGEGNVDCVVTSRTLVTCSTSSVDKFFADMRLHHSGQSPATAQIRVEAVGASETNTVNNSRDITLSEIINT